MILFKFFSQLHCRYSFLKSILLTGFLITHASNPIYAQSFPQGFSAPLVKNGWNEAEGLRFDSIGQMYVWEKGGRVWVVDTNGVKLTTPLLDIHEEVGNWRDHGLNGFCLDPNFRTNGYYYVYYTVDRNYLIYYGTPQYVASADSFYKATISRVVRYTANPATNFTTTISGSRLILIGEDKKTGMPVLHETHSGGQLVFGRDGSLLVSTGDGGTAQVVDSGGTAITITYWQRALADTIIKQKENIGAFRSQMVDCLSGKILRIDPATGNGLSSNPYYDAANPRSAKSRVWCLGLRNPYRMVLRPGTGSTDITAGDPGVLYIGDVGWDSWDDINIATSPAMNFGWPLYEGLTPSPPYQNIVNQYNTDAPNPRYGIAGCSQQYFKYSELLIQATLAPSFPNSCNNNLQIPSSVPHWVHSRPVIDYNHVPTPPVSRTGIYNGNNAAEVNLTDASSPVPGPAFFGGASTAGAWYTGTKYPVAYQNKYFHTDYVQGWVQTLTFNSNNTPTSVSNFGISYGNLVFMEYNPKDQFIYYVWYPSSIFKLAYTQSVNNPPTAVASQNKLYGSTPLAVSFTGSNSTDPENQPLTYSWNFGDGTSNSSSANPSHTFNAPAGTPTTFTVTLTVTDNIAQTSTATLKVFVNNTPPQVTITSFNDGDLYSMAHNTILPLEATVTDTEHGPSQLFYSWQTLLHHNSHDHEEAVDTSRITTTTITPVGCDTPNVYYFRIILTVTDAAGLSTTVEYRVYPACDPPVAAFTADVTSGCPGMAVKFTDTSSNLPEVWSWSFPGGTPSTSTVNKPSVVYSTAGTYSVTLTASNIHGNGVLTKSGYITIYTNPGANITPDETDSVCSGTAILLTANSGASLAYQWKKGGVDIAGATGNSYNATTAGTFKVKVIKTTTGCSRVSAAKKIVYRSIITSITPNGSTAFCVGDSVILTTSSGPYNYAWKKNGAVIAGATNVSYTAKSPGTYKAIVTDAYGCSKTSSGISVTTNCKLDDDLTSNEALNETFNAELYPNPVTLDAVLYISLPQPGILNVKIFDAIGKQVNSLADKLPVKKGKQQFKIDASEMIPGIYLVNVSNGTELQTIKMIVQNNQ